MKNFLPARFLQCQFINSTLCVGTIVLLLTTVTTSSFATYGKNNPVIHRSASLLHATAGALHFDGIDDYVNLGNNPAFKFKGSFTVEAWVKPTDATSGIIMNREGEYEIGRLNGTLQFALAGTGPSWAWVNTGLVLPENIWSHISFSYNTQANTITVTKDSEVYTTARTGEVGDVHTQWNELRIGGRQGFVQYFKGDIDEVRIWSRALCLAEIINNQSGELTLPQAGLVGYYQFNQGVIGANNSTINDVLDASGNNRYGTMNNFAKTGTISNWVEGTVTGNTPAFVAVSVADVNPLGAGAESNTIYLGYGPESLTLTATTSAGIGAYQYSWSAGSTEVSQTVTTAGEYSVTVTDAYGCTAISNKINVKVVDARCGNNNNKVLVCQRTNSNKNPWVQLCIDASAVPTHLASGSKLGPCSSPYARIATVEVDLTDEKEQELTISVGPNPTNERFTVDIKLQKPTEVVLEVRNLYGQLMQSRTVTTTGTQLMEDVFLNLYPEGLYLLNVQTATERRVVKVVKVQ